MPLQEGKMKKTYKEIIKYGLVGVVGLGVEWLTFFLFRDFLGINFIVSHVLSSILAISNNFLLNSYFTFKTSDKLLKRGISFFGIAGVGVIISTSLLPILVNVYSYGLQHFEMMEVSQKVVQNLAKLSGTVIVAAIQFVFNKYLTFKKKEA